MEQADNAECLGTIDSLLDADAFLREPSHDFLVKYHSHRARQRGGITGWAWEARVSSRLFVQKELLDEMVERIRTGGPVGYLAGIYATERIILQPVLHRTLQQEFREAYPLCASVLLPAYSTYRSMLIMHRVCTRGSEDD